MSKEVFPKGRLHKGPDDTYTVLQQHAMDVLATKKVPALFAVYLDEDRHQIGDVVDVALGNMSDGDTKAPPRTVDGKPASVMAISRLAKQFADDRDAKHVIFGAVMLASDTKRPIIPPVPNRESLVSVMTKGMNEGRGKGGRKKSFLEMEEEGHEEHDHAEHDESSKQFFKGMVMSMMTLTGDPAFMLDMVWVTDGPFGLSGRTLMVFRSVDWDDKHEAMMNSGNDASDIDNLISSIQTKKEG